MKAIWDACKAAKIDHPDPAGVRVDLTKYESTVPYEDVDRAQDGYIIDLTKIPSDIQMIRVTRFYG